MKRIDCQHGMKVAQQAHEVYFPYLKVPLTSLSRAEGKCRVKSRLALPVGFYHLPGSHILRVPLCDVEQGQTLDLLQLARIFQQINKVWRMNKWNCLTEDRVV